jgi:hypothetical protein
MSTNMQTSEPLTAATITAFQARQVEAAAKAIADLLQEYNVRLVATPELLADGRIGARIVIQYGANG